jgi:protein involved in polysaccharide export with SLBB domain
MIVSASYTCPTVPYFGRILSIALCTICLAGCAGTANNGDTVTKTALRTEGCTPGMMMAALEIEKGNYVIRPGDQLQLSFYLNSEFNRDATVRPDGAISLDVVGATQAAGLTPEQLAANLNRAYSRELRNPGATVRVKSSPSWRVYVQGQVAHAGAFTLQPGMTAMQAVAEAGGVTETAGADSAVLIRRDACGNAQGTQVNLSAAEGGSQKVDDVALMPSDVVVVPRSKIANLDLFVKQYIQGLLPFQPYLPIPL